MKLEGWATRDGTSRFIERFKGEAASSHFRLEQDLWISSIGIGTYLGNWDADTDHRYADSLEKAVNLGVNVIDTAANYRFQRSERTVGTALQRLTAEDSFGRDELVICTKGGYIPFDGEPPADLRSYIRETFVDRGIANFEDFAGGSHCMTPAYLENQLEQSLKNLGLDCIDVYYVHNPESQLPHVSREQFMQRLRSAFALLEKKIQEGKIRNYGLATWNGFRADQKAPEYHSLAEIMSAARDAGGESNGFRFIQLPFNLAMPEALVLRNQPLNGETVSLLEAAGALGVTVVASASILQGKVARDLSQEIREPLGSLATDAQTAIQFVRSTPGITTALVGMSRVEHVEENLQLVRIAPALAEDYRRLFVRAGQ